MNSIKQSSPTAETSSNNSRRFEFTIAITAIVIMVLAPFSLDGYTPSLPAMTSEFGSTPTIMQYTISFYALGAAVSQLFYGPLSDRYGRRQPILIGFFICIVATLFCAMVSSPALLILGRTLQGVGVGMSNALPRAIMRDVFDGRQLAKVASYLGTGYTLILAIAPVIGGYVQVTFGWRANFILVFLLAVTCMIIIWRFLPETNRNLNPNATKLPVVFQNYLALLTSRTFMGNVILAALTLSGYIVYCAIAPFLLQNIVGLTPSEFGWSSICLAIGLLIGSVLNGLFVVRVGPQKMIIYGIFLMALSAAVMLAIGLFHIINVIVIIGPVLFFCLASGFVFANVMVGAFHSFAHMAGATGAMYGSLQILGASLVSFLAAELHQDNQNLLATIFIVTSLLSGLIFYFFVHEKEEVLLTKTSEHLAQE